MVLIRLQRNQTMSAYYKLSNSLKGSTRGTYAGCADNTSAATG
jgi:hypothetical protein